LRRDEEAKQEEAKKKYLEKYKEGMREARGREPYDGEINKDEILTFTSEEEAEEKGYYHGLELKKVEEAKKKEEEEAKKKEEEAKKKEEDMDRSR
jgi:oligoendopeptidase F